MDSAEFDRGVALYLQKTEILREFCDEVAPEDFYRELFPRGHFQEKSNPDFRHNIRVKPEHDGRANGIVLALSEPVVNRETNLSFLIYDDLQILTLLADIEAVHPKFALTAPMSYFGEHATSRNSHEIFAMTFDLDGVGVDELRDVFHHMDKIEIIPKATYIVNSGSGLHLYYFFEEPIPLYRANKKYLKELKYALIPQIWNHYTSSIQKPQKQGIYQKFRLVGSRSKFGIEYPVRAFRHGERVTTEYLESFVKVAADVKLLERSKPATMPIAQAKIKYPEWYERRIVRNQPRSQWHCNRAIYDWWLKRINDEIEGEGHRYYAILCLTLYAAKCKWNTDWDEMENNNNKKREDFVEEEELRKDAYSLLEKYDAMSVTDTNRFTKADIEAALKGYNDEKYVKYTRTEIERLSGLRIPPNKRNYQNQRDHLEEARAVRDIRMKRQNKNWREGNGRPSKRETVKNYLSEHPDVTNKSEIARAVGLSRPTVIKYYDEIKVEIEASISRTL